MAMKTMRQEQTLELETYAAVRYIGDAIIALRLCDDDSYAGVIVVGPHVWRFDELHAPKIGFGAGIAYDSPEAFDRMACAATSFGSYYTSHNRGDDTPDWAPSAETADTIESATEYAACFDDAGDYLVRRAL